MDWLRNARAIHPLLEFSGIANFYPAFIAAQRLNKELRLGHGISNSGKCASKDLTMRLITDSLMLMEKLRAPQLTLTTSFNGGIAD